MCDSLATQAAFHRFALHLSLVQLSEVHAWAFAHIEATDSPEPTIIEVALSKDLHALEEALKSVPGQANLEEVSRLLLGRVRTLLLTHHFLAGQAAYYARQSALVGDLSDLSVLFDQIGEEIYLATEDRDDPETLARCERELLEILELESRVLQ